MAAESNNEELLVDLTEGSETQSEITSRQQFVCYENGTNSNSTIDDVLLKNQSTHPLVDVSTNSSPQSTSKNKNPTIIY